MSGDAVVAVAAGCLAVAVVVGGVAGWALRRRAWWWALLSAAVLTAAATGAAVLVKSGPTDVAGHDVPAWVAAAAGVAPAGVVGALVLLTVRAAAGSVAARHDRRAPAPAVVRRPGRSAVKVPAAEAIRSRRGVSVRRF